MLVATTVIEVGIDVPNATVMVIEGAERYGVSQLHQLRGRVGRGEHDSHCLLFADEAGELARRRLEAVAAERDGFRLAEVDLALRGEGEILGTRQHGLPRFAVAELPEDTPTLLAAREEVLALLRRHGSLEAPALGPLMDAARRRFGDEAAEPIAPMRVIAGELRGRRLVAPRGLEGAPDLRPGPRGDLLGARRRSRAPGCSTSTAAPARSRSRRSRAAPPRRSSSTATPGRRSATSSASGSATGSSWSAPTSARWLAARRRGAPGRPAST